MPKAQATSADANSGADTSGRYQRIIIWIFESRYRQGLKEVRFKREDLDKAADALGFPQVKNKGDVISSLKFRQPIPAAIQATAPKGLQWRMETVGRAEYRLVLVKPFEVRPNEHLSETKILDATPGIVARYALGDEQALLARLRYNRLVDIFTGVTCYSLQNHLRTTVPGIGQIETDEIYVGVDRRGVQFIFPVQAKRRKEMIGPQQIEQDVALCAERFPRLVCRPLAAQFVEDESIALFEFEKVETGLRILAERHYRLVPRDAISEAELTSYQRRGD